MTYSKEYIDRAEEVILHTYNRFQIVLDKGNGVHLYDVDGKEYLDFAAGIAVFALGYNNQAYNQALKDQIDKVIHTSNLYYNVPMMEAAEKLAADGIEARVINIHTIKPLDEELIVAAAKETGKVVTVEEHSVIGGLGGAVCECLAEKAPVPVKRIGVNDVFGESGPAVALLEKYGLDAEGIYKQIKEFV